MYEEERWHDDALEHDLDAARRMTFPNARMDLDTLLSMQASKYFQQEHDAAAARGLSPRRRAGTSVDPSNQRGEFRHAENEEGYHVKTKERRRRQTQDSHAKSRADRHARRREEESKESTELLARRVQEFLQRQAEKSRQVEEEVCPEEIPAPFFMPHSRGVHQPGERPGLHFRSAERLPQDDEVPQTHPRSDYEHWRHEDYQEDDEVLLTQGSRSDYDSGQRWHVEEPTFRRDDDQVIHMQVQQAQELQRRWAREAHMAAEEEQRRRAEQEAMHHQVQQQVQQQMQQVKEIRRRQAEEARAVVEEDRRRQAEEARALVEEQRRRMEEEEEALRAMEARRRAEEELRRQAEEAKHAAEEERRRREEEERRRLQTLRAQELRQRRAEEAQHAAQEEARRKHDEDVRRQQEEEALRHQVHQHLQQQLQQAAQQAAQQRAEMRAEQQQQHLHQQQQQQQDQQEDQQQRAQHRGRRRREDNTGPHEFRKTRASQRSSHEEPLHSAWKTTRDRWSTSDSGRQSSSSVGPGAEPQRGGSTQPSPRSRRSRPGTPTPQRTGHTSPRRSSPPQSQGPGDRAAPATEGVGGDQEDVKPRTLYEVLQVTPDATPEDVRKAYKRQCIKHHPDKGGARGAFEDVAQAYGVLSDPHLRSVYDMQGLQGVEEEKARQARANTTSEASAGQGEQLQAQPVVTQCAIPLELAYTGGTVETPVVRIKACQACAGSGVMPGGMFLECHSCLGAGECAQLVQFGHMIVEQRVLCATCRGEGKLLPANQLCQGCGGEKLVEEQALVSFVVPPGIVPNERLVAQGQGHVLPGLAAGDAVLVCVVQDNGRFLRKGDDLLAEQRVPIQVALCGGAFELAHLNGNTVNICVPRGCVLGPGCVKCVPGEGFPKRHNPHLRGDLVLRFQVDFPTSLSEDVADRLHHAFTGAGAQFSAGMDSSRPGSPANANDVYLADFDIEQFGKTLHQAQREAHDSDEPRGHTHRGHHWRGDQFFAQPSPDMACRQM